MIFGNIMKKLCFILLFGATLFANHTNGQSVYINELSEAKKLPPSAKKDSIIVSILYQLSHIPTKKMLKWRDTLALFSNRNHNKIGLLISNVIKSDTLINKNELFTIADQLEKLKAYSYASLFYARIGSAYTYYFIGSKEQNNAINYYDKALKLANLSKSNQDINRVYDYIGEHYFHAKDYKKSIEYLKITEQKILASEIKSLLPTVYTHLASDYLSLNQIDTAEKYFKMNPREIGGLPV